MSKTVLLARPHPFIVSEMKPFLEKSGFSVKKIDALADLESNVAGVSGAIISMALTSTVSETAEGVLSEIRRVSPNVPVLFAAMIDFAIMKPSLERIAKSCGGEIEIFGMDSANENSHKLGKSNTFVYLSKDDLTSPQCCAMAANIIQRHFR